MFCSSLRVGPLKLCKRVTDRESGIILFTDLLSTQKLKTHFVCFCFVNSDAEIRLDEVDAVGKTRTRASLFDLLRRDVAVLRVITEMLRFLRVAIATNPNL